MFSARYLKLTPYVAGEQPQDKQYIKLNTNENQYPPCPEVADILQHIRPERLRLYPDPSCTKLRQAVAETEGVLPENVFAGNGSDEVLSFCFYTFFDAEHGPVLFPQFTYSFYPVYSTYYGLPYEAFPVREDFTLPLSALTGEYSRFSGIIFPNPNAPTGIYESAESIQDLLEQVPAERIVVIDEAYIAFGGVSAVRLLKDYKNLVIVRTFSKSHCLAGIRLGYVLASEKIVQALTNVKDSFNSYPVDTLTQEIGAAAVRSRDYYRNLNNRVINTRESFSTGLRQLGWQVLPSKANFVFTRHPGTKGQEIYRTLKDNGFLVRIFSNPGIEDFVRITIGTDEQMQGLLSLCGKLFQGEKNNGNVS